MALPFRSASFLRISLLSLALGVVVLLSTPEISLRSFALATYQSLANVSSMSAAIPPNPYNTLAVQFDEKAQELSTRERELALREAAFDEKLDALQGRNDRAVLILGGLLLLFLALLLANFYYDVRREEAHAEDPKDEHAHDLSTTL